jgi:hypothetical protein
LRGKIKLTQKERREFTPINNTIINTSHINYCNIQGYLRIALLLKKEEK